MDEQLEAKRQWFETYYNRINEGVHHKPSEQTSFTCPCCKYPTLSERGGYEICPLCNWEDDGQDDPHAAEIWGGPNGCYLLTQARENFKQYLIMYSPENDKRFFGPDSVRKHAAKRTVCDAFDKMRDADTSTRKILTTLVQNYLSNM